MRSLIVYESMYGNTHAIAEAIAKGLEASGDVVVVPVAQVTRQMVEQADLVVAGGPTHVHGMSSSRTREAAVTNAGKAHLELDADAGGCGLRDWLDTLVDTRGVRAAAFDTRISGLPLLTGRASLGIARRLRSRGYRLIAEPESFLVDKATHLLPGELERATAWAAQLVPVIASH